MGVHLITGAGSGIGALVADTLAARGDDLWLVARSESRAAELRAKYHGARTVVADLADPALPEALAAIDPPDRLDSALHSAGVVDIGRIEDLDAATLAHTLAVNLTAPVAVTRWALPALRAAAGTVVFVNSGAGLRTNPSWGAYAASKAGLRSIADALRGEEEPHGVRVTSVFPGRTATPMQQSLRSQEGGDYQPETYLRPETVAAAIVSAIDLPADATVPEIVLRPTAPAVRAARAAPGN